MRYHGGKTRAGKKISTVIQDIIDDNQSSIKGYCEPFCGACGVLSHLTHNRNLNFLAGDKNGSMIEMWTRMQEGWEPDIRHMDSDYYEKLKWDGEISAQKGFIGHVMSYGGIYFQAYCEDLVDRLPSAKKNVMDRCDKLRNVAFSCGDYSMYSELTNYVIFCDPPYEKLSRYYDENNVRMTFDSDTFWAWCKMMSEKNIVIVNEMSTKLSEHEYNRVELVPRSIGYKKSDKHVEYLYVIL